MLYGHMGNIRIMLYDHMGNIRIMLKGHMGPGRRVEEGSAFQIEQNSTLSSLRHTILTILNILTYLLMDLDGHTTLTILMGFI